MNNSGILTIPGLITQSINEYSRLDALAFTGEEALSYKALGEKISALVAMLEKLGISPGDKVAILSSNMPNWGVAYLAIGFMQAVAVPILPDFTDSEVANILNHSESKAVFVSENLYSKLPPENKESQLLALRIEDFSVCSKNLHEVQFEVAAKPAKKYEIDESDLASIIYTSGTTGKSKGVMLSHRNICSNALASSKVQEINHTDRFLSLLPMSHSYENTIGLVLPLIFGASVHYIKERPAVKYLLPAMEKVQPTLILTVPLIIERIYRNKIKPALTGKFHLKLLYSIPFMRRKMHEKAGVKLMKTFGGKLKFFGIGGAKLDREVEKFLIDAKFPYAIGYGLTESAPLLAGVNPQNSRLQSTGPEIEGIQLKINNPDKKTGVGEIWAKGPNVMQGYYKDPEATKKMFSDDGWLKTGDLGVFDEDRYLYIKGRSKNVIVGPNGENVYPEELESLINNFRHVAESLVLEKKGKLVALVHFNKEELEKIHQQLHDGISVKVEEKIQELKEDLLQYVNSRVNRFSRLKAVVVHSEPFKKTPTHKIKRFLYS